MTDIRDNPPPLPEPDVEVKLNSGWTSVLVRSNEQVRQIEAAAFERGKAAMQGEVERLQDKAFRASEAHVGTMQKLLAAEKENDELRAKLKALEEQKPVAWVRVCDDELSPADAFSWVRTLLHDVPLYLASGAKP